jgi:nicotinamidase-related amidase
MEKTLKTALLVMDMQSSILGHLPGKTELLSNVSAAIANARKHSMPVIYVIVGFRAGAPEVSENNKGFSTAIQKEQWTSEFAAEWLSIHPHVIPQQDDVVVVKRRVSAFTGSDLEVVLRAQGIQHLVLTGIATSGVVLSTLREAADKDYQLTVIEDCCADRDQEVHRVLMDKVFPKQAEVVSLERWVKETKLSNLD